MDPKEEIKQKLDVAELIGEYLELKSAGGGSFKALCPFHMEKTSSFYVSKEKQIWHCFGCGEGGDVFSFVMKMEGMDFPEALRHLGNKAGVEVKRFSSEQSNEKARLFEMHTLARAFYRKVLEQTPAAVSARTYLEKRGLGTDLQETFGIGFAPDSWDTLAVFLNKRGFQGSEGIKAGLLLAKKSGTGYVDRFRGRIMIPLCDQHGNTVGFTGRVMPGADEKAGPKYMNSPETPIYRKGHLLFGLDLAKRAIKEQGCVIVVEGNLDVVASHKAGVRHVVASSGTALTREQLELLRRFTGTLIFSLDADAAGFTAVQRGVPLAREAGFDVRAAVLPQEAGKDPDEAVQKNPELWRHAISQTVPIMRYLIDKTMAGKDVFAVDDKRAAAKVLLPALAQITDVVEREHWLQSLSDVLQTDLGALRASLPSASVPVKSPPVVSAPLRPKAARATKQDQAFALLFGIAVQQPDRTRVFFQRLAKYHTEVPALTALYTRAKGLYDEQESRPPTIQSFFARLREHLAVGSDANIVRDLDALVLQAEEFLSLTPPQKQEGQIEQLFISMEESVRLQRQRELKAEIASAERAGNEQLVQALLEEYQHLLK